MPSFYHCSSLQEMWVIWTDTTCIHQNPVLSSVWHCMWLSVPPPPPSEVYNTTKSGGLSQAPFSNSPLWECCKSKLSPTSHSLFTWESVTSINKMLFWSRFLSVTWAGTRLSGFTRMLLPCFTPWWNCKIYLIVFIMFVTDKNALGFLSQYFKRRCLIQMITFSCAFHRKSVSKENSDTQLLRIKAFSVVRKIMLGYASINCFFVWFTKWALTTSDKMYFGL